GGGGEREGPCNSSIRPAQRFMCARSPPPQPSPASGRGSRPSSPLARFHPTLAQITIVTAKDLAAWHAAQLRNSVVTRSRQGRDRRPPTPSPSPPSSAARPS